MKFQVFNRTDEITVANNCDSLASAVAQAQRAKKRKASARIEIWSGKPEFAIYDHNGKKIGNQR